MAARSQHTYFYKILEQTPPTPLPETLSITVKDAEDGFIHMSTAAQTPVTAGLYFSNYKTIWLLQLRVKDLDGDIRYAPESGRGCPHLHDSRIGLGRNNVERVIEVERGQSESWDDVEALISLRDR